MRAPYVTENTLDLASDINDSMRVLDGLSPMAVESITENLPELAAANNAKYYAKDDGTVWKTDLNKTYWQQCLTLLIIYDEELYIKRSSAWAKIG